MNSRGQTLIIHGVAFAAALYVVVTTAIWVGKLRHPVVFWDLWEFVADLQMQAKGSYGLAELWRQHNEHRIPFARLVFWVDFAWFSGRGGFALATTVAIQIALVVALVRLAGRRLLAVALACAFSSAQIENLFCPFQVQFVGVCAFAAFSCAALARSTVLAAACGLVASGMMANGILVWPLLFGLAWFLRLPRGRLIGLALAGAAAITLYLRGYVSPGMHGDPLSALTAHLPQVLVFTLGYLGGPFRALGDGAATLAGALGLGAFALVATSVARRRGDKPAKEAALVAVCAFVVGSGFLTALGRSGMAEASPTAGRYATAAFSFWSSLAGLALAANARPVLRTGIQVAVLLLVAVQARFQVRLAREYQGWHERMERGSLALEVGAFGAEALAGIYPEPARIEDRMRFVRDRRLSSCANELVGWIGNDLRSFVTVGAEVISPLRVESDELPGAPGFVELRSTMSASWPGRDVVVCDASGIVLGFGREHALGQWRAFHRRPEPDARVVVYELDASHRVASRIER